MQNVECNNKKMMRDTGRWLKIKLLRRKNYKYIGNNARKNRKGSRENRESKGF